MHLSTRLKKIVRGIGSIAIFFAFVSFAQAANTPSGVVAIDPITAIKSDTVVVSGTVTWNKPIVPTDVGTGNNKLFLDIGDNANALLTRQAVDLVNNNLDANGAVSSTQFSATITTLDSATEYFFRVETPGAEASGIKGSFTTAVDSTKTADTILNSKSANTKLTKDPTTTSPGTGFVTKPQASASIGTYSILDTSVHISGSLVHAELATTVSLKYGTSANALTLGTVTATVRGFYFSADITGLKANTKYFVQVVGAKDPLSDKIGSFKTLATPSTTPTIIDTLGTGVTLGVRDITVSHAVLTGSVGTYKGAVAVYFDKTGTGQNFQLFFSPTITGRRFDEPVTGLTPGAGYLAYIGASANPSIHLTNVLAFGTPVVALNPVFKSLGATSVTVVTDVPDGITTLRFKYGTSQDAITQSSTMTKNSDGLYEATVSGLKADTNYFYKIEGGTDTQPVPYTGVFTFLTAKGTPAAAPKIGTLGDNVGGKVAAFTDKFIPCDGVDGAGRQTCTFSLFIKLLINIINFLLFVLAPIIATGLLLYGGFLILTAGDSSEQVSKAKGMFTKGITGLVIAMAAWLIVKFVMVNLGYNSTMFPTFY